MKHSRIARVSRFCLWAVVMLLAFTGQAWAQGNPLARTPAAPFDGAFSGDGVSLTLKFDAAQSAYAGTLVFKGQSYPCSGTATNNQLRGKFAVGNDAFDFSATVDGSNLTLSSGGENYKLAKQGPANPLGNKPGNNGGGANPVPAPPAAPAGNGQVGIGISVAQNAQKQLVIDKILPGGGADKAGVKPGWVLLSIEGKAVKDMTSDQIRAALLGDPGSIVRVTFDTPTEVVDALLERRAPGNAAPGAPPANPGPPAGPGGQPPVANNAPAGIGITLKKNGDDELVVDSILPGGGAEKAGVKPGWLLYAIDGKDVDTMNADQIRAALTGPAGSTVKVTFDSPTEIVEAIIERRPLAGPGAQPPANGPGRTLPGTNGPGGAIPPNPAPQPGAVPGAMPGFPGQPMPVPAAPGPQGNINPDGRNPVQQFPGGTVTNPALANIAAPDWMKPGVRVSWYISSASIPGARAQLTPDPEGNWVDPQGNRFSSQDNASASGQGILQSTMTNVDQNSFTCATKNWLLSTETNSCTSISNIGYCGALAEGTEMWQPPARLANMRDIPTGDVRVMHMDYPLDGRTYHALRIQTKVQGGWTQNTYDTTTGLLIVSSTAIQSGPVMVAGTNGTSTTSDGVLNLTYSKFLGIRQTQIPWMNAQAPQQVRALRRLTFQGTMGSEVQGAGGVKWPMTMQWTIARFDPTVCTARVESHIEYGNGVPNPPSSSDRVLALADVWIDPQVLQQLRPNQVIDEDPVTKARTFVAGSANGQVSIGSQTATETAVSIYDVRTGLVSGGMLQTKIGVGMQTAQLHVTGRE